MLVHLYRWTRLASDRVALGHAANRKEHDMRLIKKLAPVLLATALAGPGLAPTVHAAPGAATVYTARAGFVPSTIVVQRDMDLAVENTTSFAVQITLKHDGVAVASQFAPALGSASFGSHNWIDAQSPVDSGYTVEVGGAQAQIYVIG